MDLYLIIIISVCGGSILFLVIVATIVFISMCVSKCQRQNRMRRLNQNTIYPTSSFRTVQQNGMVVTTYPGKAVMPDVYQTSGPNYYQPNSYNNGNMFAPGYNYPRY